MRDLGLAEHAIAYSQDVKSKIRLASFGGFAKDSWFFWQTTCKTPRRRNILAIKAGCSVAVVLTMAGSDNESVAEVPLTTAFRVPVPCLHVDIDTSDCWIVFNIFRVYT